MKFNINKIKEQFNINKIKENFNINKIKENFNINKIKDKFDINKIIRTIILLLMTIFFWYSIILWLSITNKYNQTQNNIKEIKKVNDDNIIKFIKENALINIYSIANTAYMIDNKHTLKEYEDVLWKLTIFLMYDNNTWNYKNKIKDQILNNNGIDSILNIDNQTWMLSHYKEFINSDYVNSYLSSLIWTKIKLWNYKTKFNSSVIETLLQVMENLYVYELVFIENNLEKEKLKYQDIYNNYKYPYEKFLYYILLPSVNIWKNQFSWKINVDIFGSQYLSKASFIDLNLVKYWYDYFTSSYKWKFYQWEKNIIDNISIWEFSLSKENNLTELPIKLDFWLNDNKSFYWLISKLTSTSDQKNIMTTVEFTYYLWKNVKDNISNFIENNEKNLSTNKVKYNTKASVWKKYISNLLYKCIYEKGNFKKLNCWEIFGCNDSNLCSINDFSSNNIWSFKEEMLSYNIWQKFYDILKSTLADNSKYDFSKSFVRKYFLNWYDNIDSIDTLIWMRLYDCLIEDNYCNDIFIKGDDLYYWIKKTIIDFAWCANWKIDDICKYNFINKFETNYFIAYTMVDKLDILNNYTYLDRLKDIYKNMSWMLQIWEFEFKQQDNSFNKKDYIKYASTSSLWVYYNYISDKDVSDILNFIWKEKCSHVSNWATWDLDLAYNYIEWLKNNIYKDDVWALWVYNLNKILSIFEWLKKDYNNKTNLEKVLANLQAYRILQERWDCAN